MYLINHFLPGGRSAPLYCTRRHRHNLQKNPLFSFFSPEAGYCSQRLLHNKATKKDNARYTALLICIKSVCIKKCMCPAAVKGALTVNIAHCCSSSLGGGLQSSTHKMDAPGMRSSISAVWRREGRLRWDVSLGGQRKDLTSALRVTCFRKSAFVVLVALADVPVRPSRQVPHTFITLQDSAMCEGGTCPAGCR